MRDASGASASGKAAIGSAVLRSEDRRFVTGEGRYVDDFHPANALFAQVLRSPHANAVIRGIDTAAALAEPGVVAVLTGADAVADGLGVMSCRVFPRPPLGSAKFLPTFPILARDRVRFVGDRVALVVAESAAAAKAALELIEVDYDPQPAVFSAEAALAADAPKVWEDSEGNLCFVLDKGDAAATDAAFAKAAHVVSLATHYPRVASNAMEPRATIGDYDRWDERYTLHTSTQQPHRMREVFAELLNIPEAQLRVVAPDVGGGFGTKGAPYPEEALVVWAAGKVHRPVRWTSDRSEALLSDNQGRDHVESGELALDADGRIVGLRIRSFVNLGAYLVQSAGIPSINVANLACGYAVPAMDIQVRSAVTNTAPVSPFRGTGRPEVTYLLERLLDRGAAAVGIDPLEIRRRNLIPASALPAKTPGGHAIDSGDFHRVLERAVELSDWDNFAARRQRSEAAGRLRGIGVGFYAILAGSAVMSERMDIVVDRGGAVTVRAGTMASGQGHETVYAQMVSGWLGVPFDKVRVVQGDTDRVVMGRGSFAARSMMVGGSALRQAADAVIARAKRLAAFMLDAAETDIAFEDGIFRAQATNRTVSLPEVARKSYDPYGTPAEFGVGLDGSGSWEAPPTVPSGCQVMEVEVDADTGLVEIVRCASVDECGRVINPITASGQVHGAIAHAVGETLVEEVRYDPDSGQLLSGTYMDYGMPRADIVPPIVNDFLEYPTKSNPLGVKGVSEGANSGAPPAVVSAVINALKPLGVSDIPIPLTPERVWRAIAEART